MASWVEQTNVEEQFADETAADREELKRIASDAISRLQAIQDRLYVRTSQIECTLSGLDMDDALIQVDSLSQQIHELKGPLCRYMHERTRRKMSDIHGDLHVEEDLPISRSVSRTRSDGSTSEFMYYSHDNRERLVTIIGCMGHEKTDIQYTKSISFLNHSQNLKSLPARNPCDIESIQKGSLLLWKDLQVTVTFPGAIQREPNGSLDREIEILITESVPNCNLSSTSKFY